MRVARLGIRAALTPERRATQNETFRTFLSECVSASGACQRLPAATHAHASARRPLDGLQRWQMFMILITLIISQLLVNIWMFYAKVRA